jgi:tRNA dimethylallyltransferase
MLQRAKGDSARPFGGLVYRQAMDHLRGLRDEPATRALIAQENRKYSRRQLIWFRKEPNLVWFDGPGTNAEVQDSVIRELTARGLLKDGKNVAAT